MILSKNDMFKVSTLLIDGVLDKETIIVLSDNFNGSWAKPFSVYTILKSRPFYVGIITEEKKGDCFNDKVWDYKIFVDPFKFREEGVILDASFDLTISNPPGKASIIYYCLYECRLRNIRRLWRDEAISYIAKIRKRLYDHIRYEITKLFNPADEYLYEKILYAHNIDRELIDFSKIVASREDLENFPLYFYDPDYEGKFQWGLVNRNFIDHRLLNFSKPKIAKNIKNMTNEQFMELINSIHWEMPHSENCFFKFENPANFYLKFESEQDFIKRLENILNKK